MTPLLFIAGWVAAFVLTANMLGALFISRLLLALLIPHDTLVMTMRRSRFGLWLALRAFQIVFFRHRDQTLFCR
jgi:hypothetical protein